MNTPLIIVYYYCIVMLKNGAPDSVSCISGKGEKLNKIGCMGNTIATSSGIYFDYIDPKPEHINIEDIAKGLSNTCRFGGQCDFYSVAEHSILCANIAKENGFNKYFQFRVLMHDASEAYIGDMQKPLKIIMPEFQKTEGRIEKVINIAFGIDVPKDKVIKEIDLQMLKAEKKHLFPKDNHVWFGFDSIDNVDVSIKCLNPHEAEKKFLDIFQLLAIY